MLKTLQIRNFKGWKDTGEIKLAPITLFFGTNSSGKSSIGQFLMMLKQTVESSDRKLVIHTGDDDSYVNLGSFRNITYMHDPGNKLSFEYSWDPVEEEPGDEISLDDFCKKQGKTVKTIHFSCNLGTNPNSSPRLEDFSYDLSADDFEMSFSLCWKGNDEDADSGFNLEGGKNCRLRRSSSGRPWGAKAALHFYGAPGNLLRYYRNSDFLEDINLQQEKLFGKVFYLGPLRQAPSYLYSWSGYNPEDVGKAGKDTIAALLAGKSRKFVLPSRNSRELQVVVAESLKRMGLIDQFQVARITEGQYEVKIKTKGSTEFVNLPDVGFGISQILPVITELFCVPRKSVIIIEQPELHLHPSAQAELADIMIDAIQAKEKDGKGGKSENRDIQLLIETHSEHFLRRFLRRLAEDEVSTEQLRAYFVNGAGAQNSSKLEPLALNQYGEITNWPADFFGDELGDISAQMEAGIKKRMKENL